MASLKALVFDWGDTILRDFPEYSGPMAAWPRVEAISGVPAALPRLERDYRLALASNAAESTADQVRVALRRAGLDRHFPHIFTARELGLTKQDPGYYPRVLQALGCLPEQALMIGDGYETDVAAAKAAGMRAAWFNPQTRPCPRPHPLHDLELRSIDALPAALQEPFLPDLPASLALLRAQQAGPGLEAHCLSVAAAAFRTAVLLEKAGEKVDPLLAHRGALLHDLGKLTARQHGKDHGQWGAELLRQQGWPALAEMAARHPIQAILDPHTAPRTWEEKLVYYADKLVEGAQLVGIEARLEALAQRYPAYAEQIQSCLAPLAALEDEIRRRLGLSPADFSAALRSAVG